jgi:hypothetical protein
MPDQDTKHCELLQAIAWTWPAAKRAGGKAAEITRRIGSGDRLVCGRTIARAEVALPSKRILAGIDNASLFQIPDALAEPSQTALCCCKLLTIL